MANEVRYPFKSDCVSAPGETLAEILCERGMSQVELATRMGRPVKTINEIVKGKTAITADSALQLETVLGTPADFWNRRESRYQDYRARVAAGERMRSQIAWLEVLPLSLMRKRRLISGTRDKVQQVAECLAFFGVASADEWAEVYAKPQAALCACQAKPLDIAALSVWMRLGELEAARVPTGNYEKDAFLQVLDEFKESSGSGLQPSWPRLVAACATVGVAVVCVPTFVGIHATGLTRWLRKDLGLIQLGSDDLLDSKVRHAFFHEAAHIVLHGKKLVILEGGGCADLIEQQADNFAANYCTTQL